MNYPPHIKVGLSDAEMASVHYDPNKMDQLIEYEIAKARIRLSREVLAWLRQRSDIIDLEYKK